MAHLPEGDPAPTDGALPPATRQAWGERPFGIYVHIPFCATRCGYCDFNTYTATELAGRVGDRESFVGHLTREVALARTVLGTREVPVATVFVGGGTPTLLTGQALGGVLYAIRDTFGLADQAEVTVEANPDSVTADSLMVLREVGFTRISFGMQSASSHVLATLDRTHTPGRAVQAVGWARAAGFSSISLDLIYGTPGERVEDWRHTVDVACASGVDHVSAYALIVEPGTRLARRVRHGEIAAPDDDDMADMYDLADIAFHKAGMTWYELSNWARPGHACRHNVGYWEGADWWGIGPGAHSHVSGVRWWNVKHPATYAEAVSAGRSPAVGREVLDQEAKGVEALMLGIRMSHGLPLSAVPERGRRRLAEFEASGLCLITEGRITLTLAGRLLADHVARSLLS